jgi:hypothetical protein
MHRKTLCFIGAGLCLCFLASAVSAQSVVIVPAGGVSKDMRSVTSNRWNLGFNLAAHAFYPLSESFWVGARLAFHNWSVDGSGWAQDVLPSYHNLQSASGSQAVVEIAPCVRYAFLRSGGGLKISAQVGGGLFYVLKSEVVLRSTWNIGYSSGTQTLTRSSPSMTGFGIQIGVPIDIGKRIEILPLYSLYLAGGDLYHHIALNVGIVLGK